MKCNQIQFTEIVRRNKIRWNAENGIPFLFYLWISLRKMSSVCLLTYQTKNGRTKYGIFCTNEKHGVLFMSRTSISQERKKKMNSKGIILQLTRLLEQENFISTSERVKIVDLVRKGC